MTNFIEVKVPNGKLLQLEKLENNSFKITGDFFCHPSEIIENMETILAKSIELTEKEKELNLLFNNPEHDIIGFNSIDLLYLYQQLT